MVNFARIRFAPLILILALSLCFSGCVKQSAPDTPTAVQQTPPQIQVANAVNALAQAVDGAVTTAIAARDAGKVDQADLNAIENFAAAIARAGKQVDAELRSPDDWATQKAKILKIVAGAGLGTLKAHISPAAQVTVSALVVVVNEVSSAVGGPTI